MEKNKTADGVFSDDVHGLQKSTLDSKCPFFQVRVDALHCIHTVVTVLVWGGC